MSASRSKTREGTWRGGHIQKKTHESAHNAICTHEDTCIYFYMHVVSLKIYMYIYVYIFKRMRVSRHLVVTRSHRLADMRVKTGADEHACAVVRAGATAYECLRPPEHVRKCVPGAGAHLCDIIMGDGARAKAFIQQHVCCVGGNTEFLLGNVSRVSCFWRKPARRRPRSGGSTLASWDHALVCVFEYA
ncbi:T. brucei spp.-specific protein [Trypanosoma brucei gambiense DAL972]|uniref:T. brucei spp.-specific protein n=1 Tax=Trypanosoma brucei gambiense (strain MHOM/CI/86/DAL972) TaxID=679716 RepID=C9ZP11_TRYB9|nr:T. brucei spp.-specific protein [Trypanosoma brucei gambiense DAL972]CBH11139.1 T. brucei spp.-specific protein [Trypanosoma brucei gambiense DAL972]|eukprot:XP_011773426.1 T. brucei spp.-specific protein [Trypanosoma brucei gambiense DAL972]